MHVPYLSTMDLGITHLLNHTVSITVLSLERGDVLYEPSCPVSRLLARGETHNLPRPRCIKSREDLTSKPYFFPLVFSLEGEGRRSL